MCIGDNSLINYMPKQINPMSNINKLTCGCETCSSAILLKSCLNYWRLTHLEIFVKFYTKAAEPVFTKIQERL